MKVCFVILILVPSLAFSADRCPDFSGKYTIQSNGGQVHITIDQDECLYITIGRSTNNSGKKTTETHMLALDGVLHPDASWSGAEERGKSAAKFVSGKLELSIASATGDIISKETWQLLPNKSIEIKKMDGSTVLAKRGR
jgi:hypothetical protein